MKIQYLFLFFIIYKCYMNRTLTSKNKSLSNSRIYSDTVSLNLYNKPSNSFDDTRSICIKNNSLRKTNNDSFKSKFSNSRLLNNLSISQKRNEFINKNQNKSTSNLKRSNTQTNLTQSLIKPSTKQVYKPVNSNVIKRNQQLQKKSIPKQNYNPTTIIRNTNNIQKNNPSQPPKITPMKVIPKIIQSNQPVLIKPVNQPIQTTPNNQNNSNKIINVQEQKIPKINLNSYIELDTKSQNLNTNKSITIKSPKNLDTYTEYNNSYIECVSDNSKYIIKPEYLIFQKASDYKSYYGIDQLKLSLIDKNQNTLSATTINPLLITTKEINLFTGSIEKAPSKEKDIVNKKYVDEQIIKLTDNEKTNKQFTKIVEQVNKNIDAINLINQRITKINTNISINLKELNQKLYDNQNLIKDEIKTDIKSNLINEIKNDIFNNSLTVNELTVNKLTIPESFEHIKFNSVLDCNNITLHNIECMNNGTYNSLEIKLDNRNDIHIFDDDNNNFSFKPYSGIIETDNGLMIQKYGEYDENATRITSEDIMTKRIQLLNVDDNGEETVIMIQPINIDGKPKLQFAMRCGENEEIFYMP